MPLPWAQAKLASVRWKSSTTASIEQRRSEDATQEAARQLLHAEVPPSARPWKLHLLVCNDFPSTERPRPSVFANC